MLDVCWGGQFLRMPGFDTPEALGTLAQKEKSYMLNFQTAGRQK